MGSGNSIKTELVDELEAVWFDFLTTQKIRHNPFIPADNEIQKTYTEGTPNQVSVTKYERNPFARKKCLEQRVVLLSPSVLDSVQRSVILCVDELKEGDGSQL